MHILVNRYFNEPINYQLWTLICILANKLPQYFSLIIESTKSFLLAHNRVWPLTYLPHVKKGAPNGPRSRLLSVG